MPDRILWFKPSLFKILQQRIKFSQIPRSMSFLLVFGSNSRKERALDITAIKRIGIADVFPELVSLRVFPDLPEKLIDKRFCLCRLCFCSLSVSSSFWRPDSLHRRLIKLPLLPLGSCWIGLSTFRLSSRFWMLS